MRVNLRWPVPRFAVVGLVAAVGVENADPWHAAGSYIGRRIELSGLIDDNLAIIAALQITLSVPTGVISDQRDGLGCWILLARAILRDTPMSASGFATYPTPAGAPRGSHETSCDWLDRGA